MHREGLQTIEDVRMRFDGERRNPWDEPECGHHYARAMSAWSCVVAWSGFQYHGADKTLTFMPGVKTGELRSFWATASGWGSFSISYANQVTQTQVSVTEGRLPLTSIRLNAAKKAQTQVMYNNQALAHKTATENDFTVLKLQSELVIPNGGKLDILA
jgi:hypothetical protein